MIKPGSSPLPPFPVAAPTSMASAMKPSPAMISKHLWKRPNPMKSSVKRDLNWFYRLMTSLLDMVITGGNLTSGCPWMSGWYPSLITCWFFSAVGPSDLPGRTDPAGCAEWRRCQRCFSLPSQSWSQWLKGCDRPLVPNALWLWHALSLRFQSPECVASRFVGQLTGGWRANQQFPGISCRVAFWCSCWIPLTHGIKLRLTVLPLQCQLALILVQIPSRLNVWRYSMRSHVYVM